jgi:hypothetical protein
MRCCLSWLTNSALIQNKKTRNRKSRVRLLLKPRRYIITKEHARVGRGRTETVGFSITAPFWDGG